MKIPELNSPSPDSDDYEIHFLIDNDHQVTHLLIPVDFLYDQLHEREELFIELKRRIRDYEWEHKKIH
jgi:hypothetical protein